MFEEGGSAAAAAAPPQLPIPAEEFDQTELLAAEKESIGLFISAHPLKEVREALRLKVDCTLAELGSRRDGEWVTVGGMITQARRIRTQKGDPMMFATLDDLEHCVEMVVFAKALGANEEALAVDSIAIVRGRVDHKDRDKTCLVVQEAVRFQPSDEEVAAAREQAAKAAEPPPALRLRLDASQLPASIVGELKESHPGDSEVVLEMSTSAGERRLRLGPGYRVAAGAALHSELDALLGRALTGAAAAA
jgi:DNA polymerase-3 subunit alpha